MTKEGQEVARGKIGTEMARRGWNVSDLVRASGIDPGTAGDFLNGSRWPQRATQAKIEAAFGWPAGIIRRWELGGAGGAIPEPAEPADPTGSADPQDDILSALPPDALEGLSAAVRAEVRARMIVTGLAAIREIRRGDES